MVAPPHQKPNVYAHTASKTTTSPPCFHNGVLELTEEEETVLVYIILVTDEIGFYGPCFGVHQDT